MFIENGSDNIRLTGTKSSLQIIQQTRQLTNSAKIKNNIKMKPLKVHKKEKHKKENQGMISKSKVLVDLVTRKLEVHSFLEAPF